MYRIVHPKNYFARAIRVQILKHIQYHYIQIINCSFQGLANKTKYFNLKVMVILLPLFSHPNFITQNAIGRVSRVQQRYVRKHAYIFDKMLCTTLP